MKPAPLSKVLGALAATVVALASTCAVAQLPPPFGGPGPIIPGPQSCSPQYQSILRLQMEGMRQLQRLSREQGNTLCAKLESADELGLDKLLDPKQLQPLLTPQQRELLESLGIDLAKVNMARLMRLLGIDLARIDLRPFKHQCRQSQGEIDRFASSELGRLEREMFRCDDRV